MLGGQAMLEIQPLVTTFSKLITLFKDGSATLLHKENNFRKRIALEKIEYCGPVFWIKVLILYHPYSMKWAVLYRNGLIISRVQIFACGKVRNLDNLK